MPIVLRNIDRWKWSWELDRHDTTLLLNNEQYDTDVSAQDVDPGTTANFIQSIVPNVSGTGPAAACVGSAASSHPTFVGSAPENLRGWC